MASRGKPSRKSIEARLKNLAREVRRLRLKVNLPAHLPRDEAAIDRLAVRLLLLHRRHQVKAAFELAFDLASPMVAEMVLDHLRQTFTDTPPEPIVAQVFLELSRPETSLPGGDGKGLRRDAAKLIPRLVQAANRKERIVEERLPRPLRKITGGMPAVSNTSNPPPRPAREINEVIAENFFALPELTQRCFVLHLVEGKSLPDVAHALGLSLASVSRRMKEARLRALRILEGSSPGKGKQRDDDDNASPQDGQSEGGSS